MKELEVGGIARIRSGFGNSYALYNGATLVEVLALGPSKAVIQYPGLDGEPDFAVVRRSSVEPYEGLSAGWYTVEDSGAANVYYIELGADSNMYYIAGLDRGKGNALTVYNEGLLVPVDVQEALVPMKVLVEEDKENSCTNDSPLIV